MYRTTQNTCSCTCSCIERYKIHAHVHAHTCSAHGHRCSNEHPQIMLQKARVYKKYSLIPSRISTPHSLSFLILSHFSTSPTSVRNLFSKVSKFCYSVCPKFKISLTCPGLDLLQGVESPSSCCEPLLASAKNVKHVGIQIMFILYTYVGMILHNYNP